MRDEWYLCHREGEGAISGVASVTDWSAASSIGRLREQTKCSCATSASPSARVVFTGWLCQARTLSENVDAPWLALHSHTRMSWNTSFIN